MDIAMLGREPDSGEVLRDASGIFVRAKALLDGEIEGESHADGDGFAMEQPLGIAGEGFERVAESVAEIEQGPCAGQLELIFLDDLGLGANAGGNSRAASPSLAGKERPIGLSSQ